MNWDSDDKDQNNKTNGQNKPKRGHPNWHDKDKPVPPDLEALMKRLHSRFDGLFGNGGGKKTKRKGPTISPWFWVLLGLVIWGASGFYRVDEGLRGVELVFGEHRRSTSAGLHWVLPRPIGKVEYVNVDKIENLPLKTSMLTADENIVEVDMVVQYRRNDEVAYTFNVANPDETLQEVTESAIREVVGKSKLDYVLTEGLSQIGMDTRTLVQQTMKEYGTGIEVTSVNMQQAEFPEAVQAAVKDAIKAREDKEAAIFQAQAYQNDIVPRARGKAKQELERAKAYKEQVIAEAKGEAKRFELLLAEYVQAPRVTRDRLYIETIEAVYGNAQKIIVDDEGGNNLLYLPLDQLVRAPQTRAEEAAEAEMNSAPTASEVTQPNTNRRSRGRR